jgi:hypothetical protein
MTIHQAKGPEFPAVAVVGIKRPPPEQEGFFLSRKSGVYSERWKDWDRGYDAAPERETEQQMREGEERRLIYVAMTRAQDYLFVSSPYAGGVEHRGESLFADILACVGDGESGAVVIRSAPEDAHVAAAAEPRANEETSGVSGAPDTTGVPDERPEDVIACLAAWRDACDRRRRDGEVPAVPDSPVRFVNWAALRDFADCPLRYRYRYLLGISGGAFDDDPAADGLANEKGDAPGRAYGRARDVDPAQYGVVMHELLRDAAAAANEGGPLPADWIERAIRERKLPGALANKVTTIGGRILKRFGESALAACGEGLRLEERFLVRLNRVVFHGIFDRIERIDGGWRVLDYKVLLGRGETPDVVRAQHDFQVSFYVWALGKITGEEKVSGEICYLGENALDIRRVDPPAMMMDAHAQALDRALESGALAPTPGEVCGACEYASICPAAGR